MNANATMAPPHARRGRAVVRDGADAPLPRSGRDRLDEMAVQLGVVVRDVLKHLRVFSHPAIEHPRHEGRGAFSAQPVAARPVDEHAFARPAVRTPGEIHRKLLLGRGDEHHTRRGQYTSEVKR